MLRLLWAGLALSLGTYLWAAPTVTKVDINGTPAYIVNTHQGDRIQLRTWFDTGSSHDEHPRFAGRAHLFEHVVHIGTEEHPDLRTHLDELSVKYDARSNASTGSSRTRYFVEFAQAGWREFIAIYGDMLSRPKIADDAYEKERATVIEEAESYFEEYPQFKYQTILHRVALGETHPLAFFPIGLRRELMTQSKEDMLAFHENQYTAHNSTIVVYGNLDNDGNGKPISTDELTDLLRTHYKFNDKVPSHSLKTYAGSLNRPLEQRWIELVSSSGEEREMMLEFHVPASLLKANAPALCLLVSFLNDDIRGGLSSILRDQLGLVHDLGISQAIINDLGTITISLDLSERGVTSRYEVVETILSYLQHFEIPEEVTRLLRRRARFLTEYYQNKPGKGLHTIELLSILDQDPGNIAEWLSQVDDVDSMAIPELSRRLFRAENMIGYAAIPQAEANRTDPYYDISYSTPLSESEANLWLKVPEKNVKFMAEAPSATAEILEESLPEEEAVETLTFDDGSRALLERTQSFATTASHISITYKTDRPLLEIANKLYWMMFMDRFADELSYYQSIGLLSSMDADHFRLRGHPMGQAQFLEKLAEKIGRFQPSRAEFDQIKSTLLSDIHHGNPTFAAQRATEFAFDQLSTNALTRSASIELIRGLSFEAFQGAMDEVLTSSRIRMTSVGNPMEDEVRRMYAAIRLWSPQPLDQKTFEKIIVDQPDVGPRQEHAPSISRSNSEGKFGYTRVYPGVPYASPLGVALLILQPLLYDNTFELNRTQKGLGYVHGFQAVPGKGLVFPTFLGESTRDRSHEIVEGIDRVVQLLADDLPENGLDDFRNRFRRFSEPVPILVEDQVAFRRSNLFTLGIGYDRSELLGIADSLSDEDIIQLVRAYFHENRDAVFVATDHHSGRAQPSGALGDCTGAFEEE